MPKEHAPTADAFQAQALRYKFIYSMTGLFLGLVSMLGGIVLFLNGVTGTTSWTAQILGNTSNLTDAAPGAVLFVVGLFVVIATRYRVSIDRGHDKQGEWENIRLRRAPKKLR
jgi:hypothetical protein